MCLHAGFHGLATLSPRDCEDGGQIAFECSGALDVLLHFLSKDHFLELVCGLDDVVWSLDGWRRHVGGEEWSQVCAVRERLPGVCIQGLDRFSVLSAVVLLFETFENVSRHSVGVAREDGVIAGRWCLLRRASCVTIGLSAGGASSVSARTVCPVASRVGVASTARCASRTSCCVRVGTHSAFERLLTARHVRMPLSVTKCTWPL